MTRSYHHEQENHQATGDSTHRNRRQALIGYGALIVATGVFFVALMALEGGETTVETLMPGNVVRYLKKSSRRVLREVSSAYAFETRRTEAAIPSDLHWSTYSSTKGTSDHVWKTTSENEITVLQGSSSRPVEGVEGGRVFAWYVERPQNIKDRDNELIQRWKNAWRAYGYDPYVLGVDDARSNPEILEFESSLDEVLNPQHPREAAKRPCYLRYLAMAMQGGGMMVDLDTTPSDIAAVEKNKDAPAKFTLYCQVDSPTTKGWLQQLERQYGLPCAAVGTASEWMRIAKLVVWTTKHLNGEADIWSDMHALERLSNRDEVAMVKDQRVRSEKIRGWDTCTFRYV